MKKRKIKISSDYKKVAVIYTKNIATDEDIKILKEMLQLVNWHTTPFVVLPSEYIKKIKYIKRK